MYNNYNYTDDYLMHYGVKGMKWGVRRYRKRDGSLTNAGKKRQAVLDNAKAAAKQKANSTRAELDKFNKNYKPKKLSDADIEKLRKRDFGNDPVESADDYAKDFGYKDHKDMYRQQNDSYGVDRRANLNKKIKFYEDAAKKYGSMKVEDIDKQTIKKAEKFIKRTVDIELNTTGEAQERFGSDIEWYRKQYGL